ncbi:MAG: hypothetical protein JWO37_1820 [Acidimicrobiales bacterium]|nr:hypothetical protein [Acidimicrobiales bacterium]
MTLDERARAAARATRGRMLAIEAPEPATVMRRHHRRRRLAVAAAATVVILAAAVPVAMRGSTTTKVVAGGSKSPLGSTTIAGWTRVSKQLAGLPADASFRAMSADGRTIMLAGETGIWRSDDGFHWTTGRAPEPDRPQRVTAIGQHGDVALAVGGMVPTVWRSDDRGRTWRAVARAHDLFGSPAPQMGRPFVDGLRWADGYWIGSGGASDGHAGVWISRDGTEWRQVLGPNNAGSIDIFAIGDGTLVGYWTTVRWTTRDPAVWGPPTTVSAPDRMYPQSITGDGRFAIAGNFVTNPPTPLLRSDDSGMHWVIDPGLLGAYPDARASTIARAAGLRVAAGTSGTPNHVDGWVSADGHPWTELPPGLRGGPGGVLSLIGEVGGRIVIVGTAPELDRYYTVDPSALAGTTTS